jgi:hypothetical protein
MDQMDFGPKMQACDDRERRFVIAYLANGGNGRQAAIEAGYSDVGDGAKVRANVLLHRTRVLDALTEHGREAFRSLLPATLAAARAILGNPSHPDHGRMVQSLLSRLGYGEKANVDVNISGHVDVVLNHTDQAISDLRTMQELGIPEERLVEVFGHSGLGRYRRMLQELDGKRSPKTIDLQPEPTPPGAIVDRSNSIG